MIHTHHEHRVRIAALDEFRSLLKRDKPGDASCGNCLHWSVCAVLQRQISRKKISL